MGLSRPPAYSRQLAILTKRRSRSWHTVSSAGPPGQGREVGRGLRVDVDRAMGDLELRIDGLAGELEELGSGNA